MVPPLANVFAPTINTSVTSALVDNLINNNPTPATATSAQTTIVSSSFTPLQPATSAVEVKSSEANANTSAIDSLSTNVASQLFVTSPAAAVAPLPPQQQNQSQQLINNEQAQQTPSTFNPAAVAAPVQQSFVQSEGEIFVTLHSFEINIVSSLF